MDRFKSSLSGREKLSYFMIILIFLFLTSGLFNLQVFQYTELLTQSESNRIRVVPIIPRRGLVYDRNGEIIIDNRRSFQLKKILIKLW